MNETNATPRAALWRGGPRALYTWRRGVAYAVARWRRTEHAVEHQEVTHVIRLRRVVAVADGRDGDERKVKADQRVPPFAQGEEEGAHARERAQEQDRELQVSLREIVLHQSDDLLLLMSADGVHLLRKLVHRLRDEVCVAFDFDPCASEERKFHNGREREGDTGWRPEAAKTHPRSLRMPNASNALLTSSSSDISAGNPTFRFRAVVCAVQEFLLHTAEEHIP